MTEKRINKPDYEIMECTFKPLLISKPYKNNHSVILTNESKAEDGN